MSQPHTKAKIWVYGSLMEGFFNYEKALTKAVSSRTPARVRGTLYHQSEKGYPALVPGDDWVYGELLELEDFETIIDRLDEIENYSGAEGDNEYKRILTPTVTLDSGAVENAYVYWYGREDLNTPANPALLLPDGDWKKYMLAQPQN